MLGFFTDYLKTKGLKSNVSNTYSKKYNLKINIGYRVLLILTLLIWLLPLIAVMLTSIRTFDDVLAGNYWTWPDETALVSNYSAVLRVEKWVNSLLNGLIITIPTVLGTFYF